MHHSDRGGPYVSEQFQHSGIVCSMRRSGNVRDNVAIESLFLVAETERTERENDPGKVDELA